MYCLKLPTIENEQLLQLDLEPLEHSLGNLRELASKDEAIIKTLRGKKNCVSIGKPYCLNFIDKILDIGQEIPIDIKKYTIDYDYYIVNLCCSFLPDPSCIFTWARFGIELISTPNSKNEKAIAIDIFPDEVVSEVKLKQVMKFNPNFKIETGLIKASMEIGGEFAKDLESIIYQPQIFAYGIRRSMISWDFKNTTEKGIWGNKDNLMILVQLPKGNALRGKFKISAEVKGDKFAGIPLSPKRQDELICQEYSFVSV